MGDSGISDMSQFEKFPLQSLRILHLPGNELTKLEGLSHLEQLRELVIDHNKVKQFDENSFQGLRCLRELRAEDNGLKSLSNLGPLPRLRALYLSQNRIGELSELEKLSSLRHVMLVHLQQNPVARKPLYRAHVIQAVNMIRVIDGREVSEDEREKSEQLLQSIDPSKPVGMYVFTEQSQVGGIYMASADPGIAKALAPSSAQDKGVENTVMKKAVAEATRNASSNSQQAIGQASIMMMGQGLGDSDDRGTGVVTGPGVLAARRAVATISAANNFARGFQGKSDNNGDTSGGDGRPVPKKQQSSRSQSVGVPQSRPQQ
jgi:hypothetical protein